MDNIDRLARMDRATRREVLKKLSQEQRAALLNAATARAANPWFKYRGDPIGFVEEGLGERMWRKQKEILESVVREKRTAVPTTHGIGKTHLAARAVAYFLSVHPLGSAFCLTTSMDFNKVRSLLWPHIRQLHRLHHLPGRTTETKWVSGDQLMAQGVKPPDQAEAGISGYHKNHMLIVVDEAGGIKTAFGQSLEALTTGVDVHMLVMGNPPVNGDTTWFENICNSKNWNVIRVPYTDTPNFTGEETDICTACPPEDREDGHRVAQHLTDRTWVEEIAYEFGRDSAWFKARCMAEFVHDNASKVMPMDWLQAAAEREDYGPGAISLGCDIAAGGGDEFAIAKKDGWTFTMEHTSAGADNASAPKVQAVISQHIRAAVALHKARGIREPVRVKIDANGIGWGVATNLQQWAEEGKFRDGDYDAVIIPVNVSNNANDPEKYHRSRDEMYWNMRLLIQPNGAEGGLVRLAVSNRELAQLNSMMYGQDSNARIQIETKEELGKRGIRSPDRAEAILLAAYDPDGTVATSFSMMSFSKQNTFH